MRKLSFIIIVVSSITFLGFFSTKSETANETYRQLNFFGEVFERVRANYVEKVSDKDLMEAAINGMLQSLDPHSAYLNAKNFKEMQVQTRGEFGGLGIEVTMENGYVKIIAPIDDTPAFKAGLKTNDLITHINGNTVQGLSLSQAVEKMRGPVNSKIRLTIARKTLSEPFDVDIIRKVIKIASVKGKMKKNVAYIRITTFSEQTASGLKKEINKLLGENRENIAGIIIDLRGNPGGLLSQAVQVSDAFLDRGEIVSTRGRRKGDAQRYHAKKGDIAKDFPIIVLVNGGSASASEIVAGALQDHGRAIILGTKTFGKGSVQTIMPISGHGALRLTTSLYYTPSGRSIQAKGIAPDIIVKQARLQTVSAKNIDRNESDLRNHIKSNTKSKELEIDNKNVQQSKSSFDYQLIRAIDLLLGMKLLKSHEIK